MSTYFGRYADFQTESKKEAAKLLSADTMIGDVLAIDCRMDGAEHRAWLLNRAGERVGFFDAALSRQLSLETAKGLRLQAVLAFVAFTDHPDEGHYWGNAAIIGFEPAQAASFDPFLRNVAKRMGQGLRTQVDLGPDAAGRIQQSEGAWIPEQTVPMPAKAKGTAILKDRRTLNDRLIEQGRAGNKGCYAISWIFLLAVVTLAIFGLKSCFF